MISWQILFPLSVSLILYVIPGLLFVSQAQSENQPLTIYITGSTIPVPSEKEPAFTTAITRDQIRMLNPRSVPQLLQSLSGIHVESVTSRGGLSGVYLRGGEPNYTAVLINGIKVNDSGNSRGGAFDFSLLDVNSIERIEIVKGPLSSVYGSDAMAGVINIITTKPVHDDEVSLSAATGSRGYHGSSVLLGSAAGKSSLSLTTGFNDDGAQIEGSQFSSASVNINGETRLNDDDTKLVLNGFYQHAQAQSFPDDSGGAEYAVIRQVDMRDIVQQQLGIEADHKLTVASRFKVQVNHFRTEEQTDSPGIDAAIPAYVTQSGYRWQQLLATVFVAATTRLDASVGVEINREQGDSDSVIDPGGANIPADFMITRKLYAGFVEFRYQFNDGMSVFGGVRVDAPEEFDNETSPRVGASYTIDKSTVRVSWSEGFKLPGFFALAHPLVGNPAFKPETSESYELSLDHSFNNATKAQIAFFDNRYFDLIDFDSSGVLVQRSEVTTKGFEFQLDHQLSAKLSMHMQYSALKLDIVNSDAELLKRPERLAGTTLTWHFTPKINVAGRASYIGKVNDFAYPTGMRTLDSYTRLDVTMEWQLISNWRVQWAVDNVLDKHYEEAIGFAAPGIGLRVSVRGSI